jgi:hypothetical protein
MLRVAGYRHAHRWFCLVSMLALVSLFAVALATNPPKGAPGPGESLWLAFLVGGMALLITVMALVERRILDHFQLRCQACHATWPERTHLPVVVTSGRCAKCGELVFAFEEPQPNPRMQATGSARA